MSWRRLPTRRPAFVVGTLAAVVAILAYVAWLASPSAGVTAIDSRPSQADPVGSSSAPGVTATAGGAASPEPVRTPAPAQAPGAPAPFVQNFGPTGTPVAPVPSSSGPVLFEVGDGCDHSYGEVNQCVPVTFPPGVSDGCAWLREHGFGPLAVHGTDRLALDRNGDSIACGAGDG